MKGRSKWRIVAVVAVIKAGIVLAAEAAGVEWLDDVVALLATACSFL